MLSLFFCDSVDIPEDDGKVVNLNSNVVIAAIPTIVLSLVMGYISLYTFWNRDYWRHGIGSGPNPTFADMVSKKLLSQPDVLILHGYENDYLVLKYFYNLINYCNF